MHHNKLEPVSRLAAEHKVPPEQRARPDVEGSPENDALVLLNWISNHDKHRMTVPFLVPLEEVEFSQLCEFASEADATENVLPNVIVHAGPLSHGEILLEHRTKHPVAKVSGQFKITARVATEAHAGTQEVSEAIGQLTWHIKLVADKFSETIG